MNKIKLIKTAIVCSCILLTSCATELAMRDARDTFAQGKYEQSLLVLSNALEKDPTNAQLREAYLTLRDNSLLKIFNAAEDAKRKGNFSNARANYQRALVLDRENVRAKNGLEELDREDRHKEALAKIKEGFDKSSDQESSDKLRLILAENIGNRDAKALLRQIEEKSVTPSGPPKMDVALQKTLSIDFKDAMLKQVFEVFSRTTSVNFVFDKDIHTDQKVTVFLNGTSVKEALDVVLFTNQLEQRALDNNTILIYPNTAAKLKDYQQLTVKGFFLANADPEQVSTALKSLLKMKDVVVDKRQNLITIRDTLEGVRLAEKLIALYDLPEPEVMLEVEILEVNRTRLMELGIKYPSQLTLTPLTTNGGSTLTLNDIKNTSASTLGAQISPLVINARRETGDIQLLANPRIRVRNRDTAKILIGDKVPNITSTATATGFVSSNVQYLDVGLKLEVMPTITIDNEVAIKISLEVSNIANQITTADKTVAYQIGTRSAATVLRLKDGENQVLAGLINDNDRHSASKVPGLGDLPLVGRLFSSHLNNAEKSEIVLSITPHLVRNNLRPSLSVSEFDSGTETSLRGLLKARDARQIAPPGPAPAPAPGNLVPVKLDAVPPTSNNNKTSNSPVDMSAATIRLDGPNQVKIGEAFAVKVAMNSGQPITGVPFALGFESGKLEVLNVQEGDFLAQNGGATTFNQKVDRNTGQIFITDTRSAKDGDNTGATGNGVLATLTLKATGAPGSTNVRLITVAPVGLNGAMVPTNVSPPISITTVR